LCFFRYILPCAFFAQAALIALAVAPLAAALGEKARKGLSFLTLLFLPLAVLYAYGQPSLQGVRIDLGLDPNPQAGSRVPAYLDASRDAIVTEEVLASGCTHIAGQYWKVYPALFRVNETLYRRGAQRSIWGLTDRCQPTFELWKQMSPEELCVAVP